MSSRPGSRPPFALLAPIVALGILGFLRLEARATSDTEGALARGTFWSVQDKQGRVQELSEPASSGLVLAPGDLLKLKGDRHYESLRLLVQKEGKQSSFLDLRVGDEHDRHRLVLIPGEILEAFLTRQQAASRAVVLGRVSRADWVDDVSEAFEVLVVLGRGRITVGIGGTELLAVDTEAVTTSEVTLWADGLRIRRLAAIGTQHAADGTITPFTLDDAFAGLAQAPSSRTSGAFAQALAALLGASLWLLALCPGRPGIVTLARATLALLAPASLLLAAASFAQPAPTVLGMLAVAAVFPGVLLAFHVLGGHGRERTPLGRAGHVRVMLVALGLSTWAGLAAGDVRHRLVRPQLAELRQALDSLAPQPFTADARVLDLSNAIVAPGPYRSLDLEARVTLAPAAVLEVRLRGTGSIAEGIALCLSADPRIPTGFLVEDDLSFRPVGHDTAALAGGEPRTLRIEARGSRLQAFVDGSSVADADVPDFPAGFVTLLAATGTARVDSLRIEPAREPYPPSARSLVTRAALVPGLLLLTLSILAAICLHCAWARALQACAFALVPVALCLSRVGDDGVLTNGAFLWTSVACALLLGLIPRTLASRASRLARSAFVAIAAVAAPAGLYATLGEPVAADRPVGPGYDAFPGERLVDGLAHFQHPLLRRFNTWLSRHEFRGRSFDLSKPDGTVRVVSIGSSSTWGHALPESSGLDYPTVLEGLLRERTDIDVQVINGAIRGSTTARLFPFFREVLLGFDPDIVTLSFYMNDSVHLSQFDETDYFERITDPEASVGWWERWSTRRALDMGRRTLSRLFARYDRGQPDSARAWRQLEETAGRTSPAERFEANLRRYADIARERDIDLVLVKEPVREGSLHRIWQREFFAAMDRVGSDYGLAVVDPAPALTRSGGAALFMDAVHPLPAGHRVMAETLAPVVGRLIDERRP